MDTKMKELLDALEGMVWQFAYRCGPDDCCIHDGGMSNLEESIPILQDAGRLERYKARPDMWWYCTPETNRAILKETGAEK